LLPLEECEAYSIGVNSVFQLALIISTIIQFMTVMYHDKVGVKPLGFD